jgi:hypothetical protein
MKARIVYCVLQFSHSKSSGANSELLNLSYLYSDETESCRSDNDMSNQMKNEDVFLTKKYLETRELLAYGKGWPWTP